MPGRNLDTTDFTVYGPRRQIVTGHSFSGEITMSVYCDKYLRQRGFFEMWQKAAFDQAQTMYTSMMSTQVACVSIN